MAKRYLTKRAVAERYSVSPRQVERMVDDKRLPPPEFPCGPNPRWSEQKLDEHDRQAVLRPCPRRVVGVARAEQRAEK